MAATRRRKPLDQLSPAYRRRIESAERRGKSRAEARGHANERAEKQTRRRRYREQFGASPETMARLRKQVLRHILDELEAVGTKGYVDEKVLRDNLRHANRAALEKLLDEDGPSLKVGASMDYNTMVGLDPDFENDAGINFRWYGSKAGAFARAA